MDLIVLQGFYIHVKGRSQATLILQEYKPMIILQIRRKE